jgi:hypothetical protein
MYDCAMLYNLNCDQPDNRYQPETNTKTNLNRIQKTCALY